MTDKTFIIPTQFELLDDNEEVASVSLNPLYQWAKIVVTDDQPNANKVRVPETEFENIIRTGIFAPIKMAEKTISDGHDEAFGKPIGIISQLTKEGNKIIALAALWKKERPEDIAKLKEMYKNGTPPQVSWEISYVDSSLEEGGIEALQGTILTGLTVVGMPAYAGRTPFVAMSAKENKEEFSVEDKEMFEQKISDLEQKLAEALRQLDEKNVELQTGLSELDTLRTFKAEFDKKAEEETKLANVKIKFTEANITKEDEYFVTNKEMLLGLSDSALDFMIQELVAFSSAKNEEKSSDKKPKVPDLKDNKDTNLDSPKALAEALRERLNK